MTDLLFIPQLQDYRTLLEQHLVPRFGLAMRRRRLTLLLEVAPGSKVPLIGLFADTRASREAFTHSISRIACALAQGRPVQATARESS